MDRPLVPSTKQRLDTLLEGFLVRGIVDPNTVHDMVDGKRVKTRHRQGQQVR